MPTRKIAELPERKVCRDPEHNPPSMMVFENGLYEHTCPSCGHPTRFRVERPTMYGKAKNTFGHASRPWGRQLG